MEDRKSITLNDVAREAGVSNATVSRHVNHLKCVSPEKAKLIDETIQRLGYHPNRIARGLKSNRAMQIMIVVPDIKNFYYAEMYKTVQKIAYEHKYSVLLFNTDEDEKNELQSIDLVEELGCDGLIFCSIFDNQDTLERLKKLSIPIVTSNTFGSLIFDTVHGIKRGQGVYIGTSHLIDYGHRKIGYAGGDPRSILNQRRESGYERALDEHSIPIRNEYKYSQSFDIEGGVKAGEYFTSLPDQPTAIACANDMIAIGLIQYLNREGKNVPADMSIVGMDNIEMTQFFRPEITTVTNDSSEFATHAMNLLFSRLDGLYAGKPRVAFCERNLIIRQSTQRINQK